MVPIVLAFGLVLTGFVARSASAQLIVDANGGGGFTTIQPALDAAAPDQTILVMPGNYGGPILIQKPVKLLGVGEPTIHHGVAAPPQPLTWRCVELQGPGTGTVVIAGFNVGSPTVCSMTAWPSYPCIFGSGFSELHVLRGKTHGPVPVCLTGLAQGYPAVQVTVPLVVLAHADVKGAPTMSDSSTWPVPQAPPSIDVTGCVAILDSVIHGSAADSLAWIDGLSGPPLANPCPCPELSTQNNGSPGVKATLGFVVDSVTYFDSSLGQFVPWGFQPAGLAWTADSTVYIAPAVGLDAPLPMRIGQPWSLVFPSEWSQSTLYASFTISTPYAYGGQFAFMQTVDAATPLPPGMTSLDVTWPDTPMLLGLELVWQLYDPVLGLSRPVFDIFMP
jgi:hypothetical protein